MKIGIVSGHFDPLHFGHIEYIHESRKHCDWLIVIINNDEQVKLKKSKPFMDQYHRYKILQNIKGVDETIISIDKDKTVCETLKLIKSRFWENWDEFYFFNSGDRAGNNIDSEEVKLCGELGIIHVELNQKKIYSSSELLKNI